MGYSRINGPSFFADEEAIQEPKPPEGYGQAFRRRIAQLFGYSQQTHQEIPQETPYEQTEEFRHIVGECRTDFARLAGPFDESAIQRNNDADIKIESRMYALFKLQQRHRNVDRDIESAYGDLPPPVRAAVLVEWEQRQRTPLKGWFTHIFRDDFEKGCAMMRLALKKKRIDEEDAFYIMRFIGSISYAKSQQLLQKFPRILRSLKRTYEWGYTCNAFVGMSSSECLTVLLDEHKKRSLGSNYGSNYAEYFGAGSLELVDAMCDFGLHIPASECSKLIWAEPIMAAYRKYPSLAQKLELLIQKLPAEKQEACRKIREEDPKKSEENNMSPEERFPTIAPLIRRLEAVGACTKEGGMPGFGWESTYIKPPEFAEMWQHLSEIPNPATASEISEYLDSPLINAEISELFSLWLGTPPIDFPSVFQEQFFYDLNKGKIRFDADFVRFLDSRNPTEKELEQVLDDAVENSAEKMRHIFNRGVWPFFAERLSAEKQLKYLKQAVIRIFQDEQLPVLLNSRRNREVIGNMLECISLLSTETARTLLKWIGQMHGIAKYLQPGNVLYNVAYEPAFNALQQHSAQREKNVQHVELPSLQLLKKVINKGKGSREPKPIPVTDPSRLAALYVALAETVEEKKKEKTDTKRLEIAGLFTNREQKENGLGPEGEGDTSVTELQESRPEVTELKNNPKLVGMLDMPLSGKEQYLLLGFYDCEENGQYVQSPLREQSALEAVNLCLSHASESNEIQYNAVRLKRAKSNGPSMLPGDARNILEGSDVKTVPFSYPQNGYPETQQCSLQEALTVVPDALKRFSVPHLAAEHLAPELRQALDEAKTLPLPEAMKHVEDAVRGFLQYDDSVDGEYAFLREKDVAFSGSGRHAYLETIQQCKVGVCKQYSRLLAELYRHLGLSCIETGVLWAQSKRMTENDFHQLPLVIVPNQEGKPILVPSESVGAPAIAGQILRHMREDIGMQTTDIGAPKTPTFPDTKVLPSAFWKDYQSAYAPESAHIENVPSHATGVDVTSVAHSMHVDNESLTSMLHSLTSMATSFQGKNSLLELADSAPSEGQRELILYLLQVGASIIEEANKKLPDDFSIL